METAIPCGFLEEAVEFETAMALTRTTVSRRGSCATGCWTGARSWRRSQPWFYKGFRRWTGIVRGRRRRCRGAPFDALDAPDRGVWRSLAAYWLHNSRLQAQLGDPMKSGRTRTVRGNRFGAAIPTRLVEE